MNKESEIVISLLKEVKNQLEVKESAESSINYIHPKWGNLIFKLKIEFIDNPKFEKGTLALVFLIEECRSRFVVGKKEKIISELKELINNPKPIVEDIPNYYRMLFDYP